MKVFFIIIVITNAYIFVLQTVTLIVVRRVVVLTGREHFASHSQQTNLKFHFSEKWMIKNCIKFANFPFNS